MILSKYDNIVLRLFSICFEEALKNLKSSREAKIKTKTKPTRTTIEESR